jgi:site-specific recombinase XerD
MRLDREPYSRQQGPASPRRAPLPRGSPRAAARLLAPGADRIRNRALIAVLYRGGLRISEALALHAKEVDQVAARSPSRQRSQSQAIVEIKE